MFLFVIFFKDPDGAAMFCPREWYLVRVCRRKCASYELREVSGRWNVALFMLKVTRHVAFFEFRFVCVECASFVRVAIVNWVCPIYSSQKSLCVA